MLFRSAPPLPYQQIVDLYNSICTSLPAVRSLSDARKRTIKARLSTYTVDDFKTLFEKAEASNFLKGDNDRSWAATFDWLINGSNMAKVIEGNYDNRPKKAKETKVGNNSFESSLDMGGFETAVLSYRPKYKPNNSA